MRCSHCGLCCEETEMELSIKDINRLEKAGYRREKFTQLDSETLMDGVTSTI
jgi:Fe-S-cluster containining protein